MPVHFLQSKKAQILKCAQYTVVCRQLDRPRISACRKQHFVQYYCYYGVSRRDHTTVVTVLMRRIHAYEEEDTCTTVVTVHSKCTGPLTFYSENACAFLAASSTFAS